MEDRWHSKWEDDSEVYTASQIEAVLAYCGIAIESETYTHFICLCPFHNNTDSPAFVVDKTRGLYNCNNPSCMCAGTINTLLMKVRNLNPFQALRVILKNKNESKVSTYERVRQALVRSTFPVFPAETLDRMHEDFLVSELAQEYMKSRGFTDETLGYFLIGYSPKRNMVTVPMYDIKGNPIGIIGRTPSHTEKRFQNSVNLPKSETCWNIHNAKRYGETVIVCEASFDAMRVSQAGYPNVVALLGGHVSPYHLEQLNRHFSTVIIMTDYDKKQYRPNCRMCNYKMCRGHRPGRDLGRAIVAGMPSKNILWAAYDDSCVFPHGAKDAGEQTDAEIVQCLRNAISNYEYLTWGIEELEAVA